MIEREESFVRGSHSSTSVGAGGEEVAGGVGGERKRERERREKTDDGEEEMEVDELDDD